jgi:N6-L-threonylcarbamoyladenine synthase
MLILGIETSCDETAAALVRDGREVLSSAVLSQIARHRAFGGVVPELASRSHVEAMPGILREALASARCEWGAVDAVAATRGPGLASSLLIGLAAAKSLSLALNRPLVGVNHLEGHLYSIFLDPRCPPPASVCPFLALLVSGGHTLLVRVESVGRYEVLGRTLDDAAGEALDKGAKPMGLGYPGGPAIEKAAEGGDPDAVPFPRGHGRRGETGREYSFSFSGLKTSLLYYLRKHPDAGGSGGLKDVAASYQEAVFQALLDRVERALDAHRVSSFACVGGVARNRRLRALLSEAARARGLMLLLAPPEYCTDNAAMIAGVAGARPLRRGDAASLDVDPNLPLP